MAKERWRLFRMDEQQKRREAEKNMQERFRDNPCRGSVLGMTEEGNPIQLAWIMGRSPNSQNRVYVVEGDILRTLPADPSKVEDPSLVIYNAMRHAQYDPADPEGLLLHIVSNGDQTDTVYGRLSQHGSETVTNIFFSALDASYCEPDAPTFTPRITGLIWTADPATARFSILAPFQKYKDVWKATEAELYSKDITRQSFENVGPSKKDASTAFNAVVGQRCSLDHTKFPTDRSRYKETMTPGLGYCVTTYSPGSQELPSFRGPPFPVPIRGTLEDVMQTFWQALEPEWRVALAGKEIKQDSYRFAQPINRFERVGGE
jgi:hypothetical protein